MVLVLLYLGGLQARLLYRRLLLSGANLAGSHRFLYGFWRNAPGVALPRLGRHDYESSRSLLPNTTVPDGYLEAGAGFGCIRFAGQAKWLCFTYGVQKTPDRLPDPG
jgi:hypothetical protein